VIKTALPVMRPAKEFFPKVTSLAGLGLKSGLARLQAGARAACHGWLFPVNFLEIGFGALVMVGARQTPLSQFRTRQKRLGIMRLEVPVRKDDALV
jgi:hypothetical protein